MTSKFHDKVNKTMTIIHWYPVILIDTDILLYLLINTTPLEICSMFSKKQKTSQKVINVELLCVKNACNNDFFL